MRLIALLAVGLCALVVSPAVAGGWGGRYGAREASEVWSYRQTTSVACACRRAAGLGLPGSFFDGDGGVGGFPEADFSGGGGGFVATGSDARAFASASVRVSVRVSAHVHAGGHGHGGCGCH